jgi:hypothetical protein
MESLMYDFTETFTLALPDVEKQLNDFSVEEFRESHGLIIEIAAIHAGLTANFNSYSEQELSKALTSWTTPYPKPIIMNHDPYSEPVGRVIGARMETEDDGTPFTKLQVAISDPIAIQKVSDKRYLTGSVGGRAKEAVCSICEVNWAAPKERSGLPCRHQRGKIYGAKLAFMDMRNIEFKEYSFVNMPADSNSTVRTVSKTEEAEMFATPRFFVLDMNSESIVEYTESENKDLLSEMKKKDATPLYLGLKGAFLSSVDSEDLEKDGVKTHVNNTNEDTVNNSEENEMTNEAHETQVDEEDILAVTQELSDDLSTAVSEEASDSEVAEEEAEDVEETSDEEGTQTETNEGERPEGQEKSHDKDVDPETSEGADKSRESEEETTDEVEESEEEAEEGAETEEQADDTELNGEEKETVEPLVEELKSEVEALKEENSRLKKALHRTLAERVVDAKITLGLIESNERSETLEEHANRTASSLADSLRDLNGQLKKTERRTQTPQIPMEEKSEVVGDEDNVITIGDEAEENNSDDPLRKVEDLFVNVLMDRRKL